MALFPVEQKEPIIDNLNSTSTDIALSANQGNKLYNWLKVKSATLTRSITTGDISLRASGQVVMLNSYGVPAGTYGASSYKYGNYYYVSLAYISHEDLCAVLNHDIPNVAGAAYFLGTPMNQTGTTWTNNEQYIYKPTTSSNWYLINTKLRTTTQSGNVTLSDTFHVIQHTMLFTTFNMV